MTNSTVGRAALERMPPGTSCHALVFGMAEIMYRMDVHVPKASHNMRMQLSKDRKLWTTLRDMVVGLEAELHDTIVLPRDIYRQLRTQIRTSPEVEAQFLSVVQTYRIPTTLTDERCGDLQWWFQAHEARIQRLVDVYKNLNHPTINLVVRPGEKDFVDLADCLLSPGGMILSVDYGATFEALGHSMSIDPTNDGIFVPPIPQFSMADLPNCHNYWPKCAGRIDWTTFVDFTNVAAAGEIRGMRTLFYGPQALLEQVSRINVSVDDVDYSIPGYSVVAHSWASPHVRSWSGRETLASVTETYRYNQRWTSFKALLLQKPDKNPPAPIIGFPSWHLDIENVDECWSLDPTNVPLVDWIHRQNVPPRMALQGLSPMEHDRLGGEYARMYEEMQLAARLVDWLVATGGCESLTRARVSSLLNSQGLWLSFHRRLVRNWEELWPIEDVERVVRGILQRLRDSESFVGPAPECVGYQTYQTLCVSPGNAGVMWQ